ncbi:hypothetical protein MtrunA17_Chr1g0154141 [Medicago truncatula]|uniref:Uncharacterized protein n=1 Tax=Medicago truncatula TaxID=3880 RepID=A0A396JQP2_MEDTR|nr:hypothetical protein MtrunA17_Chr1g0154141 [Medicago truncatula]
MSSLTRITCFWSSSSLSLERRNFINRPLLGPFAVCLGGNRISQELLRGNRFICVFCLSTPLFDLSIPTFSNKIRSCLLTETISIKD